MSSRRGLALVSVLWVLILLSLIAASFSRATRTEINLTRNLIDIAKAEALADAGVYRAILALIETNPANPWRVDRVVYIWPFGGGEVRILIQDEGGKIDLNAAADELLRGLFFAATWTGPDGEIIGLDEPEAIALVDAVRDFADEDNLRRLSGAEDRDYAAAGLPWGAKDAPFEAVQELQQVLGMTPALYEQVAPALTVHTRRKSIDPKNASREVLLAFPGSDAANVDEHLAARAAAPAGAGPAFVGAEGFTARSRSRVYTIHAEGRTESGAVFAREAVVRIIGGGERPYRVHAWHRGRRELFAFDSEIN